MELELPQAAYAKMRGVSINRIRENVAAGKIKTTRKGKACVISVAEADAVLKPKSLEAPAETPAEPSASIAPPSGVVVEGAAVQSLGVDSGVQQVIGLTKARTVREEYRAKLEALAFEQRMGRVVELSAVTRAMERAGHVLVRELERIPLAAEDIAAAFTAGGVVAVRAELRQVVRRLRKAVADNLRLIDKSESTGDDLG